MIFTVKIRNQAQDLAVRFFHHGLRERSVVMFVAALYLTLSYFVSFVHDYWNKLTNYRAIIQTYRAIFKFSHLPRDKFELSRDNLRKKKKIAISLTGHHIFETFRLVILKASWSNVHWFGACLFQFEDN